MNGTIAAFIAGLPKAELHLHIEGSLEPEMMFDLARRNGVTIPFASVEEIRAAYSFTDLQDFLDIYYQGMAVLRYERDFYDLALAYFRRAAADGVRHAELFFDPQAHTARGVAMAAVIGGLQRAMADAESGLGVSSRLIMCFLRDQSPASALQTLEAAVPFRDALSGVGLDSAERDHPPGAFAQVFDRARDMGLHAVAHAGEEGPAAYVEEAWTRLKVERIDHGVRTLEDPGLTRRLAAARVPLTVCPLSNVCLRVVAEMAEHPLPRLLDAGLLVTLNSDDPAYFGGYVNENYLQPAEAFGWDAEMLARLARNSFTASFLTEAEKAGHIAEIDRYLEAAGATA